MDVTRTIDAPAVPVAVLEPPPAPVPLLAQAETALREAERQEHQARRAYDLATDVQTRERCQQACLVAKREREHAASQVERPDLRSPSPARPCNTRGCSCMITVPPTKSCTCSKPWSGKAL